MKSTIKKISYILFGSCIFLSACKKDDSPEKSDNPIPTDDCIEVIPLGNLSYTGDMFVYNTSGGGIIEMDSVSIRIKHNDYLNFKIELWGALTVGGKWALSGNHENLNGKHIKDRLATRRTIIFPDGAKITMDTAGDQLELLTVSIYDGDESHIIRPLCGKITHSSVSAGVSQQLDSAEADGETSTFEISETGLLFFNIYFENVIGEFIEDIYNLGQIYLDQPNVVSDYYDDPRIGHT